MSAGAEHGSNWVAANQRLLMAELGALGRSLRAESGNAGARTDDGSTGESTALREAREAMPAPSALDALCGACGLSDFERRILLLCAGVELDGKFGAQCAAAPGSAGNPWPSFGLALAAFPGAHWDALAPGRPLRYWRLVEITGNGPLVTNALRIDERVLFHLTGVPALDERLAGLVQPLREPAGLPVSQRPLLQRLAGAWEAASHPGQRPPVLQLCGADPGAKRDLAAHLAKGLRMAVFSLTAASLPPHLGELEMLQRLWEREAMLGDAALLLECDRLEASDAPREAAVDRWIELTRGPLLVSSREPRRQAERAMLTVDIGRPTAAEQRLAWQQALGLTAADGVVHGQLDRVVSQFDFSIASVHAAAGRLAGGGERPAAALAPAVWEACRFHARAKMEGLALRIESGATWKDIVLPEPLLETLREISVQVRHRAKVYEDWGFAGQSARGLGLGALFCGPSGTGKTLAAEVLANDLQLDLYRIDLSAVVSKYIGETEKNLRRVFDAAEEGGAILFFDEADALFGKRSEVKDSHDRYANIEVSYLLQRMEAYRGLAILATNLKDALDPAFLRRLRFVVQFPFPDQAHRAEIWRRIFPAQTPTERLEAVTLARLIDRRRKHSKYRPQRRLRRRRRRRAGADGSPPARRPAGIRKA